MHHLVTTVLAALAIGFTAASPALARDPFAKEAGPENETPKNLSDIGVTEHLGEKIDLGLKFRDENNNEVTLRDFMKDGKPMLLSLAYYTCPSLCNYHLNGLVDSFKQIQKPMGSEFKLVVVSIQPNETSVLATTKKAQYLKIYNRPEGDAGFHFLVGNEPQIAELAKEVGFKYRWDADEKQYAHASVAYVLTPDGHLSRYLYGIVFNPKDVRLSMVEASSGKIGTLTDQLILYCFHFDPKASKYTLAAFNLVRAGGILIVLLMGAFLVPFWFRKDRHQGES